jgi:hypothetical protein
MIDPTQVNSLPNSYDDSSQCECHVPLDQTDLAVRSDFDENLNTLATAAVICCNKNVSARTTDSQPGMLVVITSIVVTNSHHYQARSYHPFRFLQRTLLRLPACMIFQSCLL